MLGFLRGSGRVSERKLRLFAVACCRQLDHLLVDHGSREAVEVAERYADGAATDDELDVAQGWAEEVWKQERYGWEDLTDAEMGAAVAAYWSAEADALAAARGASKSAEGVRSPKATSAADRVGQCRLLRCLFGPLPSRPRPPVESAWLKWNGGTVLRLAGAIYDGRRFEGMPVLADALEDAGVTDAGLLGHLRGPGPHVRGCWVVDWLTGRQ
jgi:hypothetical protein